MKNFNINTITLKNSGFSLVELMVSMFLSLVILAGLINLYSSNKSAYRSQESINRIQEAHRFAADKIQKELRLSGYYGCNRHTQINNTLSSTPFIADYEKPIEGFNATNMSTWDRSIANTGLTIGTADGEVVRGGTDILVVRRASREQYPLRLAMGSITANPRITQNINPAPFSIDDVVIISDCTRSAIFQVTDFTSSSGTIKHQTGGGSIGNATSQLSLAPPFNSDASVMKLDTIVFFIGTSANGMPSLKRKINNNASETIVTGVENMQILYGLDTDGDDYQVANRYVGANNITSNDWKNVTTARIALLMLSRENNLTAVDTSTYELLDETVKHTGSTITHAGDLKFRQVVKMTIDVRNPNYKI